MSCAIFFVQSDSVFKGCLIDQGSYYSLTGKSNAYTQFQIKDIERKKSQKNNVDDQMLEEHSKEKKNVTDKKKV